MSSIFGLDPVSLALGVLVFVLFWKISQTSGKAGMINKIPGPMAFPVVGNILELTEPREILTMTAADKVVETSTKVLTNVLKRRKKFGPIIRIWVGMYPLVFLSKPEYAEILLRSSKHSEKGFTYSFLHPWLGTGLLTSFGKKWSLHRKLITPTFHFKVLQGFVDVFHENASILVNKLKGKAETGEEFDIYGFVTRCTLDIICETAMGTKVHAQSENQNQYVYSVYRLSALVLHRMTRPWLHPDFLFKMSSAGKEFQGHLDVVQGFTNKVIQSRRQAFKEKQTSGRKEDDGEERKKSTFLDLLLESSSEGGSSLLTDEQLREEVETFMFEGHDTTASGISWTISVLGRHPKIQEDCYQEVKAIFEDDPDRVPTITDLTEMKYLERVIKEALRMYPSVTTISRTLEEDVWFGEYVVPKGTDTSIGIYSMHWDPEIYPNPDQFDPDRFLPEVSAKRHPYAYIPFSAGPRNCIGQKFALLEEKAVLSLLLRNYRFEATTATEDTPQIPDIVLRPGSGIGVKIYKR